MTQTRNIMRALDHGGGQVHAWATAHNFSQHIARRALILATLWVIIAYLIVFPLLSGSIGTIGDLGLMPEIQEQD